MLDIARRRRICKQNDRAPEVGVEVDSLSSRSLVVGSEESWTDEGQERGQARKGCEND